MKHCKTVSVEGVIGSGKSTLLKYIDSKNSNEIQCVYEPIDKWTNFNGKNLLKLFYDNPSDNSFVLQSYIQLTMIEAHRTPIRPMTRLKILERSVHSAVNVFIQQQVRQKTLKSTEADILKLWYDHLINEHAEFKVDTILYMRATPEICLNRIKERNRIEETSIDLQYLIELNKLHENWLNEQNERLNNVIVIDANKDISDVNLMKAFDSTVDILLS